MCRGIGGPLPILGRNPGTTATVLSSPCITRRPLWRMSVRRTPPVAVAAGEDAGGNNSREAGKTPQSRDQRAQAVARKMAGQSWLWKTRRFAATASAAWEDARRRVPVLAALAAAMAAIGNKINGVKMSYYEFCGEETKRKWKWEKYYGQEAAFWKEVMVNTWLFFMTCLYEIIVPINMVVAVLPPAIVAILYSEKPWRTGIAIALYVMLPIKFLPLSRWGLIPSFA